MVIELPPSMFIIFIFIFGEGAHWLFVLGGTCEATNNLLCISHFGVFILLHHCFYFVGFYDSCEGGG
jgi:hypothetical protein